MPVRRTIFSIIGGLLLAGIIHIGVVFMVPYYAVQDAWGRVERLGRAGQFHRIASSEAGAEPLPMLDPAMLHAVCRFSTEDGPVRISATLPDEFWSVAIFDRRGRNIYSLNNRSVEHTQLDLAILTPVQMAQLRQDPPESLETAVVVEVDLDQGFVLLRLLVPDETQMAQSVAAMETADCSGEL